MMTVDSPRGWYKVEQDGEVNEAEDGEEPKTFPPDAEVYIWLQLSQLLVPREELDSLNVVTVTVKSLHQIPEKFFLKDEETEEDVRVHSIF